MAQLSKRFQLHITPHKQIIRGQSQRAQFLAPNWHEAGTSALHEAWVSLASSSVTSCGCRGRGGTRPGLHKDLTGALKNGI